MAKKDKDLEEEVIDALAEEAAETETPKVDKVTEPKGEESDEVIADTDTDKGEADKGKELEDKSETPSEGKYKIGEEEYSADELVALLEKGKLARKVEEDQKLDISQLLPEFTRRSQLLKNKDALMKYVKDTYGDETPKADLSEEQKRIETEIEAARKLGFITKKDLDEFRETITKQTTEAVEQRELAGKLDKASSTHKVDRNELIEYMLALRLEDPDVAATKLALYKGIAVNKPKIEVPRKPEVLNTEKKGSGLRVPQKERAVPHPDKDPEAFEARILEFLEHKSPEEV